MIPPPSPAINPPKLVGDLKFIKRSEYLKSKQPAQSPLPLVQLCAECIGKNPTRFSKAQLRLPAELINSVLEHLVHKKLLSPANVDLLMGSGVVDALVLGHNNSAMSAASLESIAASGTALKGLVLQNMVKLTDEVLAKIVAGCPGLMHLDISFNCEITAPAVESTIAHLPSLRRFIMQRGRVCVGRLVVRNSSLEELLLPTCGQLRDVSLDCPRLTLLDLQDCNNLLTLEWAHSAPSVLRHLLLRSCIALEPASLGAFLPHCPEVEILNLYNTAQAVRDIWPHCAPRLTRVTELVLSNSRSLTDDGVLHIARHMQELKLLFLAGSRSAAGPVMLSDQCLRHIAAHSRKLETIALPPFVSDADALEAVVRANVGLRTVDFGENKQFHDDAVEAVLTHCKNLYALNLNDCRSLTDGAFSVLSDTKPSLNGPKRKSEEELQIGRTVQNLGLRNLGLTDASLSLITARCPLLSAIDLYGNVHITDLLVSRLVTARGATLKRLTLAGCVMLTDVTVQAVTKYCKVLTHLDLYGVSLVTNTVVWTMLQAIPTLQVFNADPTHLAYLQAQLTAYNVAHTPQLGVRVGATRSE